MTLEKEALFTHSSLEISIKFRKNKRVGLHSTL